MNNQYLNIPVIDLYDTCRIELDWVRNEQKEIIKHTIITYSLSETGKLIKDEHLLEKLSKAGFNRSLSEVDNYEEYLNIHNGNVSGWYYQKCRDQFLGKRNIAAYESLKRTAADYRKRFEDIKDSEFAQNVLQYFIQVQLEFESWFWQNDMEVPNYNWNQNESSSSLRKNNKDTLVKPKKNISEEAITYLRVIKKIQNPLPRLKELKENSNLSISTWCRRLKDRTFLMEVVQLIQKEIKKSDNNPVQFTLLNQAYIELSSIVSKLPIIKSNDIIQKRKRNNGKPIESFPDEMITDPTNSDDEKYNTAPYSTYYKLIFN